MLPTDALGYILEGFVLPADFEPALKENFKNFENEIVLNWLFLHTKQDPICGKFSSVQYSKTKTFYANLVSSKTEGKNWQQRRTNLNKFSLWRRC